jgi:hypothetical protein
MEESLKERTKVDLIVAIQSGELQDDLLRWKELVEIWAERNSITPEDLAYTPEDLAY